MTGKQPNPYRSIVLWVGGGDCSASFESVQGITMQVVRSFTRATLLVTVVLLALGCAKAKNKIVPVEGTLTFMDGSPLPAGTRIRIDPAEGGVGTATGAIDDTGAFNLIHVNGTTGAEVGKYVVLLLAPKDQEKSFYKMIPKDYYDGSILVAEVKEGMAPLTLKVPRAKGR
jgi:hypothetical protein